MTVDNNAAQPHTPSTPIWVIAFQWTITLVIPLLLVVGSTRLVMTPFFLTLEYTRPGFPADSYGFSTEDRLYYGSLGVEYLLNGEEITFLESIRLPGELCYPPTAGENACPLFNSRELQHMLDVKIVVQWAYAAGVMGLGLFLISAGMIWQYPSERRRLPRALKWGSILTLSALVTIIFVAFVAWDVFFNTFHDLFFEPGTWRFFYSDSLIRLYPEQFWFDASLTVGALSGLGAIALWLIAGRLRRFNKPIN